MRQPSYETTHIYFYFNLQQTVHRHNNQSQKSLNVDSQKKKF